MPFHKMINIFSLIGVLSVNATAVDYQRRHEDPRFREGDDGREYNPRIHRQFIDSKYDYPHAKHAETKVGKYDSSFTQPSDNKQEIQQVKNEILRDIAKALKDLPQARGFEANIAAYINILNNIMKSFSASNLPFRAELLSVLEGHKNAVIQSAKKNTFLTEKMIFDSLGGNGEEEKETDLQKAFRNGRRMSGKSFELLKNMKSQKREELVFNKDDLKIFLMQMLMKNHVQYNERSQCLRKDKEILTAAQSLLPASANIEEDIDGYIQSLEEESNQQSVLPIILKEIQKLMSPAEWEEFLENDPVIANEIVSDKEVWADITRQKPDGEIILPWTDPAVEQAEENKKKIEEAKTAKEQKEEKQKNKSTFEKKTGELKEKGIQQAQSKGTDLANKLLGKVLGSVGQGDNAGGAADALKGLLS